ncbi:MAG: hypothetical protein Q8L92_11620, partial [Rubrivivax sp.]|nr:hypothetical protein [Rubrivivax sp.]
MSSNELTPLTLLVQCQGGRIQVLLSDLRSVGLMGSMPWHDGSAARWHAALQAPADAQALQALGRQLFDEALPEPVRAFLRRSEPRLLTLQTDDGAGRL